MNEKCNEENVYKYDFNEAERISIDCWYDIVILFRSVQWEHTDHAILEHKQYVINCLVDFICELDNFKEEFENTSNKSYLDDLRNALVKLMKNISKKINENDAPIFFETVYEVYKKSARIEN
ncbi:hypothetical protein ACWEX2_13600 [Staphylococcus xylosus]|uniref:Uncharacterized protein n=1 Tax=Staphylococcus xylosus TaxID=1288 RepID=A0AAQ0LXM7_STAXY|nr:hypothetical protein [Staphylococcus xylosus]RIM90660.1 hypothetical protein BU104_13635 [Staphylococcus xylosus]